MRSFRSRVDNMNGAARAAMPYRIERLPLTTIRGAARNSTLARLTRRRTRLPARTFSAFIAFARKLKRQKPANTRDTERLLAWLSSCGAARRNIEALRDS